jgi:hypothetical protein
VAIGAKELYIIRTIIEPIAVPMVYVEGERFTKPFSPKDTSCHRAPVFPSGFQ